MIIIKTKDGYVNDRGDIIPLKSYYEQMIKDANEMVEPTEKELIEIGKIYHTFYQKNLIISNAENNIKEIEKFDKTKETIK